MDRLKHIKVSTIVEKLQSLKDSGYSYTIEPTKKAQYERIYVKCNGVLICKISIFKNHFNTITYMAKAKVDDAFKMMLFGCDVTIVPVVAHSEKLKLYTYACAIISDNFYKGIGGRFKEQQPNYMEALLASACNALAQAYKWDLVKAHDVIVVKLDNLAVVQALTNKAKGKVDRFKKYLDFVNDLRDKSKCQIYFHYYSDANGKLADQAEKAQTLAQVYFKEDYDNAVQTYTGRRLDT